MAYVVAAVDTSMPWPKEECQIPFRGRTFTLRPGNVELAPSIVLEYNSATESYEQASLSVSRFMSALTWSEGFAIHAFMWTGGGHPIRVGRKPNCREALGGDIRADYLSDPPDKDAELALALYREALAVNAVSYKFLGFFKVINIRYGKGRDQVSWINATLPKLQKRDAIPRVAAIQAACQDVGKYLYESGRCAVAHANLSPVVDPEEPEDVRRLHADLPVARALAEYLIEHELGVKSRSTIWNEHLFELAGFRRAIGEAVAEKLRRQELVVPSELTLPPLVSIRVRGVAPFAALENLTVRVHRVDSGLVVVEGAAAVRCLTIRFGLSFPNERLWFDVENSIRIVDDGTKASALALRDYWTFLRAMFGNGELEIWDPVNNERLGCNMAFIPINVDLARTIENFDGLIEQATKASEERPEDARSN
jgi:hypothetical protein